MASSLRYRLLFLWPFPATDFLGEKKKKGRVEGKEEYREIERRSNHCEESYGRSKKIAVKEKITAKGRNL